jgi:Tol biopolymer transport system component
VARPEHGHGQRTSGARTSATVSARKLGTGRSRPDASAYRRHTAVLRSLQNGVWVVDLSSGDADHIVTGNVGPAKWSPDGTWLVFGLAPLASTGPSTVWMARADGRQLRQSADAPSWTPVWLPPG